MIAQRMRATIETEDGRIESVDLIVDNRDHVRYALVRERKGLPTVDEAMRSQVFATFLVWSALLRSKHPGVRDDIEWAWTHILDVAPIDEDGNPTDDPALCAVDIRPTQPAS